ncbi:hypothetical protein CPC08DRAFT_722747 [Agrocybe pediades]|nr:hypothetical protein CPC08DRAFT_722747 [Agrocybe pediades]
MWYKLSIDYRRRKHAYRKEPTHGAGCYPRAEDTTVSKKLPTVFLVVALDDFDDSRPTYNGHGAIRDQPAGIVSTTPDTKLFCAWHPSRIAGEDHGRFSVKVTTGWKRGIVDSWFREEPSKVCYLACTLALWSGWKGYCVPDKGSMDWAMGPVLHANISDDSHQQRLASKEVMELFWKMLELEAWQSAYIKARRDASKSCSSRYWNCSRLWSWKAKCE